MKHSQIKEYLESLLDQPGADLSEVGDTIRIFSAYIKGLQGEKLPIDILTNKLDLQEEIPEPFHALVLQSSILKSKQSSGSTTEYLYKQVEDQMGKLLGFFIQRKLLKDENNTTTN